MKQDLVELISAMPTIETHFRKFEPVEGLCVPSGEFIYDDFEFIEWQEAVKFELQEIFDRTKDKYIWNIINVNGVIHKFDGKNYNERESFNKLKGSLSVIQKNIDKYYPTEMEKREEKKMLKSKIFISHSSEDLKYVVFMLSNNYYESPVCLNEMGAAWVLKSEYTSILLRGFEYKEIKGAVNPNKIGMKLDDEEQLLKKRLGELKDLISKKFCISVPDMRWEKKRNDFIKRMKRIS